MALQLSTGPLQNGFAPVHYDRPAGGAGKTGAVAASAVLSGAGVVGPLCLESSNPRVSFQGLCASAIGLIPTCIHQVCSSPV
jgi:hypothetical protein